MTCEETTPLLMDRLQGDISPENEERLAAHVATCADCRAEVEAMTETWEDLGSLDDEDVPHERLRARFHAGLAAYEARESRHWTERLLGSFWPRQPALQMALAAALALVGVLVGQQLPSRGDAEVAALRNEVRAVGIALLDHQSASERLLGVKWAQGTARAPEVIGALLERVQYDTNLSVRLAAVDALRADLDNPDVVAGLAMALERQESPLLQVALTDALLAADEPAVEAVRAVLGRTELDPAVRQYLEMALNEVGAGGDMPRANNEA
ncbi:MAG TPA: zf-HC2 domain-containing protein [Gammaproteobacteria bacterium]|nr:zf-HC2 domain-containing protein [Gammaproteobacteria bacterium]